jgi:hypothetical protein
MHESVNKRLQQPSSRTATVRQPYGANFFFFCFSNRCVVELVSFDGFKHLEYSQKLE